MKNKAHMIVSNNRVFTPKPWRISVCAMDAIDHSPIFVSMVISQAEPLKETNPELLTKRPQPQATSTHPVFIAYRNKKETLVSSVEEPMVYLSPSTIINRVIDVKASYDVLPLCLNDHEEKQRIHTTHVDHHHSLAREYWDITLSNSECERLFNTVGYINRKGQPSIIPRSTFKEAMAKELSSILTTGLAFSEDTSHSLFTIQFQRYFA
tara:strand:+ start:2658 stop:3284 length:627 start_codon:yes stop_codon:yes gene_type:complete